MAEARAPVQVLVLPYHWDADIGAYRYCVFKRADTGVWQAVAGGARDGEAPIDAARRELREETGCAAARRLIELSSRSTIPVVNVGGFLWGPDTLVVTEHAFGADIGGSRVVLSPEHTEVRRVSVREARDLVKWDSNRNALWELNHRLVNSPDAQGTLDRG